VTFAEALAILLKFLGEALESFQEMSRNLDSIPDRPISQGTAVVL